MSESLNITNEDCMELMARYPDNHFDLAIVDPPYGIGIDKPIDIRKPDRKSTWTENTKYTKKEWDSQKPCKAYWNELMRVSKNQIVWGGNYFTDNLSPSKCWVFWDKQFDKTFNFSHGELAWTSFNKQLLKFTKSSKAETRGGKDRIHPTQKPISLYLFILERFASEGNLILDTHLGSGSIAIAVDSVNKIEKMNLTLTACEIDKEYYDAAMKRISEQTAWQSIF